MSATPPGNIKLPSRPTPNDILGGSALAVETPSPAHVHGSNLDTASPNDAGFSRGTVPRPKGHSRASRPSFGSYGRGHRLASSRGTPGGIVDELLDEVEAAPKLPSLVPGIRPAYSTPLPVLPIAVLCIAMSSEMLAANLCTPFILKQVEGFFYSAGHEKSSDTEAAVGLWTGNLVSVFFITQFLTSLLWSSIADRHGRRAVLVASLLGSCIALVVFGTSESLPEAICVRLVQGIFGGAVGVFRGSIRDLTDETNASRAYAMLGFAWSLGGVLGPLFGGVLESPEYNYPGTFLARVVLFQEFPYLLPTLVGATILFTGAVLSCFLSWDGGVRGGRRIELQVEKDEPLVAPSSPDVVQHSSPAPSSRTAVRIPSTNFRRGVTSPGEEEMAVSHGGGYPELGKSAGTRRDSRASVGTAYGYGGIRSKRPTLAARAALEAARRVSTAVHRDDSDDEEDVKGNKALRVAQKLLLANEENTFNINDLWVSAAVAQDTAVFDDEEEETEEEHEEDDELLNDTSAAASPSVGGASPSVSEDHRGSLGFGLTHRTGRVTSMGNMSLHRNLPGHRLSMSGRRFSTTSGHMPAIFSNTGVRTPPAVTAAYNAESPRTEVDPFFQGSPAPEHRAQGGLAAIAEAGSNAVDTAVTQVSEKMPSSFALLPVQMIVQYGLLALHNTIHDQVFLSFLVTPYKSGGLGLNPAHFSLIISLMCLCQLVYQFYLYPRLGPPLGRFTHLQMFRIGCALYVPSYLLLPLLHKVASAESEGGFLLMVGLVMVTALRYCAGTFAYTSVMVLINAMSPPQVVGLSNGLAQSTVSFSRFFGPVIGGAVWSASINGNPNGYAFGFYFVTIGCAIQCALSLLIR
ncbi:hypothetical protein L198_04863 [Cryptococcus wingfieldii CBS 7118]|uniref:Major facilitator superfamily (MFS) profile domain-containing protein n=1 Tax=Cryptococcus wingfieldii CBS 7118 TaxID=1295528 RepID=A0A1E3J1F4_9TREE|nr:hypothetical protein L198_04863 [Cryptococcus wingfieldii CBS 7118]ODN94720.1 hypothetical protein L198_04863 [Cryptococcus wingfieldii CBS 7118]